MYLSHESDFIQFILVGNLATLSQMKCESNEMFVVQFSGQQSK